MTSARVVILQMALLMSLSLSLGLFTFHRGGPGPLLPQATSVSGEFPVLTTLEVVDSLRLGETLLLDARSEEAYDFGHIPGAIPLPPGRALTSSQSESARNAKLIVVYCGGLDCDASLRAARSLRQAGLGNIAVYEDGIAAWREAGLPTQGTSP